MVVFFVCGVIHVNGCRNSLFDKTNPSLPTPIIKQYHSTVQVVQSPKRVLVEREVCNRISGCKVVSGTCPTCVIDKVWE